MAGCCESKALTSVSCRAPEPGTGRWWVHVWNEKVAAETFAEELRKRTHDNNWAVVEVAAPPPEGPMDTIIVQVGHPRWIAAEATRRPQAPDAEAV